MKERGRCWLTAGAADVRLTVRQLDVTGECGELAQSRFELVDSVAIGELILDPHKSLLDRGEPVFNAGEALTVICERLGKSAHGFVEMFDGESL